MDLRKERLECEQIDNLDFSYDVPGIYMWYMYPRMENLDTFVRFLDYHQASHQIRGLDTLTSSNFTVEVLLEDTKAEVLSATDANACLEILKTTNYPVYVGETDCLRDRLSVHRRNIHKEFWEKSCQTHIEEEERESFNFFRITGNQKKTEFAQTLAKKLISFQLKTGITANDDTFLWPGVSSFYCDIYRMPSANKAQLRQIEKYLMRTYKPMGNTKYDG